MILEVAILYVKSGEEKDFEAAFFEAKKIIGASKGYIEHQLQKCIETKGKYIIVSVVDNGVGISKENLDNLFRIDIQHSTLGTNSEKGTGLGLFLVKEFVAKQKGELKIESDVGKGSSFSFTVPRWNV